MVLTADEMTETPWSKVTAPMVSEVYELTRPRRLSVAPRSDTDAVSLRRLSTPARPVLFSCSVA